MSTTDDRELLVGESQLYIGAGFGPFPIARHDFSAMRFPTERITFETVGRFFAKHVVRIVGTSNRPNGERIARKRWRTDRNANQMATVNRGVRVRQKKPRNPPNKFC